MLEISKLEPQIVWEWFDKICAIPHPTYHEEKIGRFLKEEAEKKGLHVLQDEKGNILIDKPATRGKENLPMIAMQAHMDMVPQKKEGYEHNFETDPILPRIDGEWVYATNTTLGADNGMGLAMGLAAIYSDEVEHPPLRLIVTVEEETGMGGALKLDASWLDVPYLLNLDTEELDCVYLGCAGGRFSKIAVNLDKESNTDTQKLNTYQIQIKGLKGGHSGIDIDKERGNANLILCRLLSDLYEAYPFSIAQFDGGSAKNAIPRDALAKIKTDLTLEKLTEEFQKVFNVVKEEIKINEPLIEYNIQESEATQSYTQESTLKVLNLARVIPNGVISKSVEFENVVDTSLSAGLVYIKDDEFIIESFIRSLRETPKEEVARKVKALAQLVGACFEESEDYPGWNPNPQSQLLKFYQNAYTKVMKEEPQIQIVHAGLECGILLGIQPKLDVISFGPTIKGAHSPEERVNIDAVQKCWEILIELLRSIDH